jgi:2-keto-3-deoxy-L-rhamnonate aldolase RhmA
MLGQAARLTHWRRPSLMSDLRERVRSGERVIGTFLKSPGIHQAEIIGRSGLDFLVIDAEHAPFGLAEIDPLMASGRIPALVRTPDHNVRFIGACLDLGAQGVLVPHVRDRALADSAARAARFIGGDRGFSPSVRAFGFGLEPADPARTDEQTSVWCQIEDADALGHLDEIAAVPGVDCLFVGPADLAQSLSVRRDDPPMTRALNAVAAACKAAGRAAGIFVPDLSEVEALSRLGFSVFVCGSDQSLLSRQARELRSQIDGLDAPSPSGTPE